MRSGCFRTPFALLVVALCMGSQVRAADQPSILFVIADQWRAQAFGFAGDPNVQTPHLDALQRESIDCVNTVSGVPVCCPARTRDGREYRGVRTERFTYVRDLKGPWLLFDNQADPYQTNNLVNKPAFARLQSELEATLTRKLEATGDQFLPGDAYIKKWACAVTAGGTVPYTN